MMMVMMMMMMMMMMMQDDDDDDDDDDEHDNDDDDDDGVGKDENGFILISIIKIELIMEKSLTLSLSCRHDRADHCS